MVDSSLMFHIFEILKPEKTMGKQRNHYKYFIFLSLTVFGFISQNAISQPVIGLDNWYNREVNVKTGIPFHYLWTDTAFSGYSRWGKIFTSRGAKLTTIEKPDANVLGKINIYIVVDPDSTTESKSPNYIMPEEIMAIEKWVRNGGVLALLGNDAPNCEFTHFNQLASKFGITFNHVTLHPVTGANFEMGASKDLPDHPLFKGVTKIYMKEVSDINLSGTAKAILTENRKVLIAENRYGKGYVFAIGDPWIYNEYIDHDRLPVSFENRQAAENLTDLLLSFIKKK
jgi:unsaturated rhamnogalacturonyl hydrolase